MPEELWNKTCLVYDHGLFVELAVRLARDFGKVLYYSPWKTSFPTLKDAYIGDGIEEIQKVFNFWDVVDEVDLFVFPDVYDGDLQVYLRKMGKRVWGSGNAEFLELDRVQAKEVQKQLQIASPRWDVVVGLKALRERLSKPDELFVKTSVFRGDSETFRHKTPYVTKPVLDDLQMKYGPHAEKVEFLIEAAVEGVEIGYDGYTVDGQFPGVSLWGVEKKDRGYVGRVVPYDSLPQQIRDVNAAFAPVLREEQCRSFVSFELRVDDAGKPYVIDPCLRCGNPPTEAWLELYNNLGEIFWEGAEGKIVDPVPVAKFAAMAIICSSRAQHHWTPIHVPRDMDRWVKIRYLTMNDDDRYYTPKYEMVEIGAVVGLADTAEEAIELVKERAGRVEGAGLEIHPGVLDEAAEELEEISAKFG